MRTRKQGFWRRSFFDIDPAETGGCSNVANQRFAPLRCRTWTDGWKKLRIITDFPF